jgi:hypothetical protein
MAGEIALIESPQDFTLREGYYSIVIVNGIPKDFSFTQNEVARLLNVKLPNVNPSGIHFHNHTNTMMLFLPQTPEAIPYSIVITRVAVEMTSLLLDLGLDVSSLSCYMSGFKTKGQLYVYALCKCYGGFLSYINMLVPDGSISSSDLNEKTLVELEEILREHNIDLTSMSDADTYGVVWSQSPKTKKIVQLPGIFDGRNEHTYLSFIYN